MKPQLPKMQYFGILKLKMLWCFAVYEKADESTSDW